MHFRNSSNTHPTIENNVKCSRDKMVLGNMIANNSHDKVDGALFPFPVNASVA